MKVKTFYICFVLLSISGVYGQIIPRRQDVIFSRFIVRSADLNRKDLKEIFGEDKLFIQILIRAMKENKLQAYSLSDFKDSISYDQFKKRLVLEASGDAEDSSVISENAIHVFEFEEVLVFDSKTSTHYFIPIAISLVLTADINPRGLHETVCCFRFSDCEKVFKGDANAFSDKITINKRSVNFADILVLKCIPLSIVKIGNRNSLYFDQIYSDPVTAFLAQKESENKVIEELYKFYNP